jgi:NAD(P)-dependent dehydrogenase (short-subunit alcohol dehydrogenase family)
VSSAAPAGPAPIALVTGAGTGIGRASALQLAEAGAKVMAVGRRAAPLQSLCSEHGGISYMAQALDSPEGCARAVAQTAERLGPPLILVHAAGLGGHVDRPIWEQTTQAWRATMAINLDAAFELVRLTVPAMRDAGFGRIVLVGSTAGSVGAPAMSAYSASKAGLTGLARSVACDVAPFGVTCNAVAPTWVRGTEMAELDAEGEARARSITVEEIWRERSEETPAKRVLDPSEVAAVIAFLASPAASGVTGAEIDITLGAVW